MYIFVERRKKKGGGEKEGGTLEQCVTIGAIVWLDAPPNIPFIFKLLVAVPGKHASSLRGRTDSPMLLAVEGKNLFDEAEQIFSSAAIALNPAGNDALRD